MTKATERTCTVSLFLSAPIARPDKVAPFIARHIGLSPQEAAARLLDMTSPLATNLTPQEAQQASSLLSLLGVPVTTEPQGRQSFDLCIQLAVWAEAGKQACAVAKILHCDPDHALSALGTPAGLVIECLDHGASRILMEKLGRRRGLILSLSDRDTAVYDIHTTRPLDPQERDRLVALCRLIGARADELTDAVASGLNQTEKATVLTRLADLDLQALDRRFQRFDLLLTGAPGWKGPDLADFLVTRTQKPRAAFEQIAPDRGVKLDIGLRDAVARQFCADYAAIGLLVRPILSSRGRNA